MYPHHTNTPTSNGKALQALRHPLVAQACEVPAPSGRRAGLAPWGGSDPDRLVILSCLASFLVMPFLL